MSVALPFAASAAPAHHVFVLHSFGRGIEPFDTFADSFRTVLTEESPEPIELHEISLETALLPGTEVEGPFVDYLRAFDAQRKIDLVVTIGGPAARFVQRNRSRIFAATPLLMAAVDQRHLVPGLLTPLDAQCPLKIDLGVEFGHIFRVRPSTRELVLVLGASPLERFWADEMRREFEPFATRARLTILNDIPFRAVLERVRKLTPDAAIWISQYAIDVEGVPHTDDSALIALRKASAVPIFGLWTSQLGKGIVGGPLLSLENLGRAAATSGIAILQGADPATLRVAPIGPGKPTYDWRELKRFDIDAASLPPSSAIEFRPVSAWERSKWGIVGAAAIVVLEGALIVVLWTSLAGRRRAEEGLRKSREQYALAVDGVNDGLWDWNILTGAVYFSERCKRMLGYRGDELADRYESWDERVHDDDREKVSDALESHLEGNTPAFRVEHRIRHKDGSYRWMLARGKAQRDAEGRPYRMAGSLTDITELKAAEEAIRNVNRQLILAQEDERARLARELHDDVTQRLARAAIDAGRIELTAPNEPIGEMMGRVRQDLIRLSEDVHALSYRLHPSLLEDLGLAEALQVECERFSAVSSVASKLDVRDLPDSIPRGAAICLFRVAQEALRNVDRHARAHAVEVSLRGVDGGLQLAVRDDGIGFDPNNAQKPRSLGRASMRERIQLAAGEIDIDSAPGQGTTIVAWVPLQEGRT